MTKRFGFTNNVMLNLFQHLSTVAMRVAPLTPTLSRRARGRRAAFTLAEVLITLAIIGVVAAMTIPTLIAEFEKKQTVAKLKSTYALLFQAIQLSEVDNGPSTTWNCGEFSEEGIKEFANKYFASYLKIIKKCSYSDGNCRFEATSLNGENSLDYCLKHSISMFLPNGVRLLLARASGESTRIFFILDLNGDNKPNIIGKDIFEYELYQGKFTQRAATHTRERLLTEELGCHKNGTGDYCAHLIMLDGWKIDEDYPW